MDLPIVFPPLVASGASVIVSNIAVFLSRKGFAMTPSSQHERRLGDMTSGSGRLDGVRVLIYSHDSFGLGHLRRCRAIAHALVDRFKGLHVLIVCGSQIAGAFDFRARVDFVKVPSVIKLYNGEYTSISEHIDIAETIELRKALILCTAQSFKPDIMIVDKEPFGLHEELKPTLSFLKSSGCVLALGLRDVMDAPHLLDAEWARKGMVHKIETFFDQLWVYGPEDFYDPLEGLSIPQTIRNRVQWTGYLHRDIPGLASRGPVSMPQGGLLVTAGGGGDGAELFRQVVGAYAHDATLTNPALLVLGPFMSTEDRDDIRRRASTIPALSIVDFDNRMEALMDECAAVVSMGGYNTFCEILSLNKNALLVPRIHPRQEQFIRARRAAELGLIDMLHPSEADDPAKMAAALHALAARKPRDKGRYVADMTGLMQIGDLVYDAVKHREQPELRVIAGGRHRDP